MDIIFINFWTFSGTLILLFFILAIVLKFKPIQINKYYVIDKNSEHPFLDHAKSEQYFKDSVFKHKTEPPVKETSMNDSVWKILLDIL
jgi:hypothetical protein